ncbi:MAG TPA: hypothetical protein VMW65_07550, partial [Chloroflexota bacterium]|nr:hypothetical protein [Chloroflexota bacterium]
MSEVSLGFRPYLDGYYDASLQLQMHVYRRSEALFQHFDRLKDAIDTPEKALAWQAQVRRQSLATFGGLPDEQTPLEPERLGTVHGAGFDIEKIIFQSMPRVYVTANLYLLRDLNRPTGTVLFVCGHSEQAKVWPEYQAVCQRMVRNGLVVLAIDPFGQGERKSYLDERGREIVKWGPVEHTFAGFQCWWLGQSSARYFVHDARRAIDYLVSRPEVDPSRIGMTGNSGGATQTAWTMLVEDRLAAAAPATFITRRRDYLWTGRPQDAEQHLLGGTSVGIDHEDCLIALAPKPVLVLAADSDYFNVEGTVAAVERARQFYRLLGKPDNVRLVRASGTHAYHPALAMAATAFFVKHLLDGDPRSVDHREPELLDPDALLCTPSGQVLVDRPETRRIFDLNLAEYQKRPTRPPDPALRVEMALGWLKETIYRHRRPGTLYPRWLPGPEIDGGQVRHGLWWSEVDV